MLAILAAACFFVLLSSAASPPPPTPEFFSFSNSTLLLSPSSSLQSDHTLLLDATSSSASAALYNTSVAIYDDSSSSVRSFVTELTFVTNTSGGILALVLLPTLHDPEDLDTARTSLSIEFSTTVPDPDNGSFHWQYGHGPERFGDLYVAEYLKTNASILQESWYPLSNDDLPCDLPLANIAYDLLVAYDSGSRQILVGSRNCNFGFAMIRNCTADLSDRLFTGSPYIGLVANGSEYYIHKWSFSVNANSAIASLKAAADFTTTDDGGYVGSGGRNSRLSSAAKIGIAIGAGILGAGILVGLVLCACAAARRRRSAAGGVEMKSVPAAAAVRRGGAGGRNGVVIEIQKKPIRFSGPPPPPPPPQQQGVGERDTEPLTRNASYAHTGTAGWLPPVVPR